MKTLRLLLLLLVLALPARASQVITLTLTVTNTPADGNTFVPNSDTRTWKTSVATPASQIVISNTIGALATNLYTHFSSYGVTGPLIVAMSGTNGITLRAQIDKPLAATLTGSWGTLSYSTQTVTIQYPLNLPLSAEPTATNRTRFANWMISALNQYSTTPLSLVSSLQDTIINGGYLQGTELDSVRLYGVAGNTNHIRLYSPSAVHIASLVADTYGFPALVDPLFNPWLCPNETFPGQYDRVVLNYKSAKQFFASERVASGIGSNYWDTTNWFANAQQVFPAGFRATNATIVTPAISGGTVAGATLTTSTYSGTIGSLTNGTLVGPGISGATITTSTYSGTIGNLTNGTVNLSTLNYVTGTATNLVVTNLTALTLTASNTTHVATSDVSGDWSFQRANTTALANGNNAAISIGVAAYVKVKAGPTAAFAICGIAGGRNGRLVTIINRTGQAMTIANESGVDATPANRIQTLTGADIVSTGDGAVTLLYDSEDSRWQVIAWQP